MAVTIDKKEKYINPYNFISLGENCKKGPTQISGTLTGYIECILTTKTETIVPGNAENTINPDNQDNIFFNYGNKNKPVIPGSELRGMLRSDYEVFTDSCLSTVDDEISFIKRSIYPKKPGILKKDEEGNWHLYQATRYRLQTTRDTKYARKANKNTSSKAIYYVDKHNTITIDNKKLKTGDKVKFIDSNNKFKDIFEIKIDNTNNSNNIKEGILFIGELGAKKSNGSIHDSIFVNTYCELRNVKDLNIAVKKLKDIVALYNDSAFNKAKEFEIKNNWYEGYNIDKIEEVPVWYDYKEKENRVYLSPACIGKEAYYKTLSEMMGSYMPCITQTNICDACDLFGFISKDDAKGSKIRISDAICTKEGPDIFASKRIIKELSSPHISNETFYSLYLSNEDMINKGKDDFDWNLDYQFINGRMIPFQTNQLKIRGRKAYWHHYPTDDTKAQALNKRNGTITPVKENISFKFKVYFDDINEDTLKKLIAVINLKYDSDASYENKPYYDLCHKIGKAKPFGYGSVKIRVEDIKVRKIDLENNDIKYKLISKSEYINTTLNEVFNTNSPSFKDALRMYNFNYLKANYKDSLVTYPLAFDGRQTTGFAWFQLNKSRNNNKNSNNHPFMRMVLPLVKEGGDIIEKEKRVTGTIEKKDLSIEIDGLNIPKYQNKKY